MINLAYNKFILLVSHSIVKYLLFVVSYNLVKTRFILILTVNDNKLYISLVLLADIKTNQMFTSRQLRFSLNH